MGNVGRTNPGSYQPQENASTALAQLYPAPAPAVLAVRMGGTACRELRVFLRELVRELGDVAHNRKVSSEAMAYVLPAGSQQGASALGSGRAGL